MIQVFINGQNHGWEKIMKTLAASELETDLNVEEVALMCSPVLTGS